MSHMVMKLQTFSQTNLNVRCIFVNSKKSLVKLTFALFFSFSSSNLSGFTLTFLLNTSQRVRTGTCLNAFAFFFFKSHFCHSIKGGCIWVRFTSTSFYYFFEFVREKKKLCFLRTKTIILAFLLRCFLCFIQLSTYFVNTSDGRKRKYF